MLFYNPADQYGTVIENTDLTDLTDETISTLDLMVRPRSETPTRLLIDATIELTSNGWSGTDYTLNSDLQLLFPVFGTR